MGTVSKLLLGACLGQGIFIGVLSLAPEPQIALAAAPECIQVIPDNSTPSIEQLLAFMPLEIKATAIGSRPSAASARRTITRTETRETATSVDPLADLIKEVQNDASR